MNKKKFVDCFMLMNTALSLRGGQKLPEMGRPLIQDVFTTFINLSLSVQEFKMDDVQSMNLEITGLLNQKWRDPRLGANMQTRKMAVAGQIWKPKLTNIEGRRLMCNNEDSIFWRGFGNDGDILLSEQIKIETKCTSIFNNFPFDSQFCELKFGSFRFPEEEVSLMWDEAPIDIYTDKISNEFTVTNVSTYIKYDLRASGNFSVAVVQFTLHRDNLHYIICTILPCIIITLLNYFTLWFEVNNRNSRVNLNVFSFGVLLYFYYTSTCGIQPVPYLKALDIFTGVSTIFSIINLLETFIVDSYCNAEEDKYHMSKKACRKEYPKNVYWIELLTKISFPCFYTFFVTLYGSVYVN